MQRCCNVAATVALWLHATVAQPLWASSFSVALQPLHATLLQPLQMDPPATVAEGFCAIHTTLKILTANNGRRV